MFGFGPAFCLLLFHLNEKPHIFSAMSISSTGFYAHFTPKELFKDVFRQGQWQTQQE